MKFKDMKYERIDYDKVEKEAMDLMKRSKEAKSGEELFEVHKDYYKFMENTQTMITICHIRHDIDTKDEFYDKENEYNNSISPKLNNLSQMYYKGIYESEFRPYMEEKIGKVAFKNIEIAMKAFDEKLIPLMQEENKLTSRYDKLIASAENEWEGEI